MDENIELGGNIALSGFGIVDGAQMIILKKTIGNYGKVFSEKNPNFQRLILTCKPIHETETSQKYQINSKVEADKVYTSEVTERNIFIAVDSSLKKIKNEMSD